MTIVSLLRVQGGVPDDTAESRKGGLAQRGLLLSFGDLEDGVRSEFRLAEALWMDVLETSLSSRGHGH